MTEPKVTSRQVYELKIKSLTSKPVTEFLPEIQRAASALASRLAGPESTLDVKIDRQKTIALDPLTIIILIEVVNLTAKPLIVQPPWREARRLHYGRRGRRRGDAEQSAKVCKTTINARNGRS
jgi:hypothetical protein